MATVLQRDITHTLQRLRDARNERDEIRIDLLERKLNKLLESVPKPRQAGKQKSDY